MNRAAMARKMGADTRTVFRWIRDSGSEDPAEWAKLPHICGKKRTLDTPLARLLTARGVTAGWVAGRLGWGRVKLQQHVSGRNICSPVDLAEIESQIGPVNDAERAEILAFHRPIPKSRKSSKGMRAAHAAVFSALVDGRLAKSYRCSTCGWTGDTVAHHEDYSKPLDVIWLCRSCHKKVHDMKKVS